MKERRLDSSEKHRKGTEAKMKANQQRRYDSLNVTDGAEVRARGRNRLPENTKPGRILSQNPDYEAILAAIELETRRKETDIT